MPDSVCVAVANAFHLLADPTRRRLVELAATREQSVGELVKATRLTQPAISKQLALLREGGLVAVRRDGRRRLYRTRKDELLAMRAWLEKYGPEWNARMDDLEAYLEKMK